MTDSYTLYIHEPETDDDIDDDLYEPAAFQIPIDMQWNDLQDLICNEVGVDKMSFSYIDDEKERVRIDSQEEYEIALDIRKFEGGQDLHIYASRSAPRPHRRQKRRERKEKEKREEGRASAVVRLKEEDEVEIYRPPVEEPERASAAETAAPQREEANRPPPDYREEAVEAQEDTVTSTVPDIEEETVPMPVVGNPIVNIVKKEVKEALRGELEEVWEYVRHLEKGVNEKLDAIGEHLVSETRAEETAQKKPEQVEEGEKNDEECSAEDQAEEKPRDEDTNNYAASFICESLLDGSRVHTGASFQKYWVFRNEGSQTWDESTKLHLLEETCTPAVASGNSLSEWGAKKKSVGVPPLRHGETGVVCAEHAAPAHRCDYTSSWRLSHDSNAFGPRVWCNVRVVDDSSPFASASSYDSAKNLGSYEVVTDGGGAENPLQNQEEELHAYLVPPEKVKVEIMSPKHDDSHNDHNIMSFNMADISEATKYVENERHEADLYNPAVTSVEQQKEESPHASLKENEKQEASFDVEEQEDEETLPEAAPESIVMVQHEEAQLEEADAEEADAEEPRTLEGPESTHDEGEDARPEAERQITKEEDTPLENFTEPVLQKPDHESSFDEEEEEEPPQEEHAQEEDRSRHGSSEDLHSVDFNLDDDASMASYVSDFVVVPLPECFDVNRPLNVPEEEPVEEKQPVAESQDTRVEEVPVPEVTTEDPTENYPPSDSESSDEEVDSQPNSTTHVKEYKSEDSMPIAPKSPSHSTTESLTQQVNLAPNFLPPISNSIGEQFEQQPGSMTNSVLNSAISQNFQAFTTHPASPPPEPPKPKVPMNKMPGAKPKIPLYEPQPLPVPPTVLNQDEPYNFDARESAPYFPPFEQGWRRNPLPVPTTVLDETPWVPTHPRPVLPKSEFTLNRNSNGIESTLPSHPFATTGSPYPSLQDPPAGAARQRSISPTIELPEDFYPPGLAPTPGANMNLPEPEPEDEFQTPPPSPPPFHRVEPTDLDRLYEMGFHDMDLNREMFDRCGHDINRTVQALVLREQADEEDITMDILERRVPQN